MAKLNSLYNFHDDRADSGLHTGLFVKTAKDEKFSLFMPGTTTPFLSGDYDTIEWSILQNDYKSKIFGKMTIDDKEVEFSLHRDNVIRIESFVDQSLEFLSVTGDGLGYKSMGRVKYRPNDAEEGSAHTGTYTIVASSTSTEAIRDVRPLIQDTVLFSNAIPESLTITNNTDGETVDIESLDEGFSLDVKILDNDKKVVTNFTATKVDAPTGSKKGSVTFKKGTGNTSGDQYACAYITISKQGFASWTTTILLESH